MGTPGIIKGRAEETLASRREILVRLLRVKFGEVPPTVVQQVGTISSKETLDNLLEQLINATSFADMGLDGRKR